METPPHTLITCIVNKGMAETVMDAARKAGATGGTILPPAREPERKKM